MMGRHVMDGDAFELNPAADGPTLSVAPFLLNTGATFSEPVLS